MNRSTPGLPVHHQLLEFTQTHVHQVSDAIRPSHPLSSRSPPAPNPSQHQSLFQWVNSSHEVAKVLEFQLQHHSFQSNPRADLLQNGLVGSPCSEGTLKSLLQHHSSKASILRRSAFFTVGGTKFLIVLCVCHIYPNFALPWPWTLFLKYLWCFVNTLMLFKTQHWFHQVHLGFSYASSKPRLDNALLHCFSCSETVPKWARPTAEKPVCRKQKTKNKNILPRNQLLSFF